MFLFQVHNFSFLHFFFFPFFFCFRIFIAALCMCVCQRRMLAQPGARNARVKAANVFSFKNTKNQQRKFEWWITMSLKLLKHIHSIGTGADKISNEFQVSRFALESRRFIVEKSKILFSGHLKDSSVCCAPSAHSHSPLTSNAQAL